MSVSDHSEPSDNSNPPSDYERETNFTQVKSDQITDDVLLKQTEDIIQTCKNLLQTNQKEIQREKKKANKRDEIMVFDGSTPLMRKFKTSLIDKLSQLKSCQPLTDGDKIRFLDEILSEQRKYFNDFNQEGLDSGFDNGAFYDEHTGIYFLLNFDENLVYFGQSDRVLLEKIKSDIDHFIYEEGQKVNLGGSTFTLEKPRRRGYY